MEIMVLNKDDEIIDSIKRRTYPIAYYEESDANIQDEILKVFSEFLEKLKINITSLYIITGNRESELLLSNKPGNADLEAIKSIINAQLDDHEIFDSRITTGDQYLYIYSENNLEFVCLVTENDREAVCREIVKTIWYNLFEY